LACLPGGPSAWAVVWALTLADAGEKMEAWRKYHNEDRPHRSIEGKAPVELANPGSETGQLPCWSPVAPPPGNSGVGLASGRRGSGQRAASYCM
jgi:hypothetical protein